MRIEHWRFEDGLPKEQVGLFQPDSYKRGYYCWAYVDKDDDYGAGNNTFDEWLRETFGDNDTRVEWQFRFNSGDPMTTVQIWNDADAVLFQLKWGK